VGVKLRTEELNSEKKFSEEEPSRLYPCERNRRKAERLQFLNLLKTQKVTSQTEIKKPFDLQPLHIGLIGQLSTMRVVLMSQIPPVIVL
jgi:hypothetical protein